MIATLLSTLALTFPVNEVPAAAPVAADQVAIKAKTIWLGDGRKVEDGVLLMSGGKIERVGRGVEVPANVPVIEHDGTLTAGLVALHTYTGGADDMNESTRPVTADCDLVHAFRPGHDEFKDAAKAGITTVVLTPPASNVAAGVTCVVKTAGGDIVKRRAQLAMSICTEALSPSRYPTSYESAMSELHEHLEAQEGAFGEAKSGELSCLIDVRSRQDVHRALQLAKHHGLKGALYGANLSGEIAGHIKESGFGVVYRPFGQNTTGRTLDATVKLAEAGVPFGFGLDAPANDEMTLRYGAVLCVRAGVEPQTAWKALTADAARIAGVESRVGSLAQGLDADIVLWSGDPLDLASSIEAVYVGGELVHGGDQ